MCLHPCLPHDRFPLVHTYVVSQYISWGKWRTIVQALGSSVAMNGILILHFLKSSKAPLADKRLGKDEVVFPLANWVRNVIRRKFLSLRCKRIFIQFKMS